MDKTDKEQQLSHMRHSLAHLLAATVLELYPDTKTTIGPAIENGFYYDFDFVSPLSENNLPKIEKKMKELLPSWQSFEQMRVSPEEAKKRFENNEYKRELIDEIVEKGENITLYTSGDFTDLCRGGHVENPNKDIASDAFSLTHTAGAYWRGDEHNKMLTRIYGVAFDTKKELGEYFERVEEAKKRDHRKLGKELGLFVFSDLVGSGLPLWTPKGTLLRDMLYNKLLKISLEYGMTPVTIPHLAKRKLYETSGHADKFSDELLTVQSRYDEFVLKPVNCPHHTQIYAGEPRSYRDLPLRFMESTMQYRDEKPGEIGGLTRVRAITVDDGHIFCTIDQVKAEAINIARIIEHFYTQLGLFGNHWVSLSVRDPQTPDAYIGEPEDWEKAESMLQDVSDELSLDARRVEGEAAIYGPKLDYIFKDSLGREWQLATIQIDFAMPKRFGLEYTDSDGSKKTPVMIHRAILGSYERFLAILIEHFAGAFPTWLSPVQAVVLPISEAQNEYARGVYEELLAHGVRAEIDESSETLNKKIRDASINKTPYVLVIGNKELEAKTVTVEGRDEGKVGVMSSKDFIDLIKKNQ